MIKKDINMIEGPIFSRLVVYTLPLLFSGVLQLLYNAADVAVVGNFASDGEKAIAAVGSTGPLTNLLIGLFLGLSVGACVVLSQCLGAKDDKDASEVVHTSMLSGLIIGVALSFVGIILAKPLLALMATPADVLEWSSMYMQIYFVGLPMSMVYNFGAAVLRAKGDTRFPLIVLVISGAVNVVLNLITVIGFKMDVAGVAIATVASQTVSAVMVVVHLCKLNDCCRLYIRRLKIHKDKLLRIARVGIPAGFQSVVFSLSNVLIQSSVNSLGKEAMAGNTAAANIDGFIYIAQNSVYHAAMAFTGQNVGAKNVKRVRRICWMSLLLVTVIGLLIGSLVGLFSEPLLSLYAPGADKILTRQNGLYRLEITAWTQFLCGIMEVFTGMLRGMGSSVTPMIISLIGACGVRIIWIFEVFPREFFHNMRWLYFSYPLSWILTIVAQFVAYLIIYNSFKKRMAKSQTADGVGIQGC